MNDMNNIIHHYLIWCFFNNKLKQNNRFFHCLKEGVPGQSNTRESTVSLSHRTVVWDHHITGCKMQWLWTGLTQDRNKKLCDVLWNQADYQPPPDKENFKFNSFLNWEPMQAYFKTSKMLAWWWWLWQCSWGQTEADEFGCKKLQ